MRIRPARREDAAVIRQLIYELAVYERAPDEVEATEQHILDTIFCDNPAVFCEIIELDDDELVAADSAEPKLGPNIAGMAIWFLNYSTWQGRHGIYLEDLYVREKFRGRGYGKAMLEHLAAICIERGYGRFQWWVLDWNTPSIEFYRAMGAQSMDEWTVFRVSGDALNQLGAARSR
jgi:GNAT superfamily N-acetyltransferase